MTKDTETSDMLPDDPIDDRQLPTVPPRFSSAQEAILVTGADASVGAAVDDTMQERTDEATEDTANPV